MCVEVLHSDEICIDAISIQKIDVGAVFVHFAVFEDVDEVSA